MKFKDGLKANANEIRDTFYLYILQIVDKICPLIIIPYLMFTLQAEKYGYIGFATAVIQYISLIVEFGFNLSATKRIAVAREESKEKLSRIFLSTFYAKLILLALSTIILICITLSISSIRIYFSTIMCIYPLAVGTTLTASWFYQGMGKIRIVSIVISICKISILPLTIIFVKSPDDYNIAAFIQSFAYFMAGIITLLMIHTSKMIQIVKVSVSDIKIELKESYPLFLSTVATSVYTQLFILILGFISTPAVVGRYSAAERIMRSLCFAIYSPISAVFYPKIASIACRDKENANHLLKNIMKFIFFIMFLLSLILLFFSEPLSLLLGNDYDGISSLLKIMAFVPIAIALGAICGQMGLIALGDFKTKRQFQSVYFMAAPFSLVSVAILSYMFVEIGAAIALLLTEYFVFIMMFYFYKKHLRCYYLQH